MLTRMLAAAMAVLLVCGFLVLVLGLNAPDPPPDPEVAAEDAYWRDIALVEEAGEEARAAEERCAGAPESGDRQRAGNRCPKR
jgi:hypothetical protein